MKKDIKKLEKLCKGLRLKMTKQGEIIDQYGRILELNSKGDLVPTGRCGIANN